VLEKKKYLERARIAIFPVFQLWSDTRSSVCTSLTIRITSFHHTRWHTRLPELDEFLEHGQLIDKTFVPHNQFSNNFKKGDGGILKGRHVKDFTKCAQVQFSSSSAPLPPNETTSCESNSKPRKKKSKKKKFQRRRRKDSSDFPEKAPAGTGPKLSQATRKAYADLEH